MWRLPISLPRWLYRSTNKEPGQDGQFDDCTKDVLGELCEDDYSDAKEEFQANLDTDQHLKRLKLIDDSSLY